MLVLAREFDQKIVIDLSEISDADLAALRSTPIKITVLDIRGEKVRLGITAPASVGVHREEVYAAIQEQRQAERKQ